MVTFTLFLISIRIVLPPYVQGVSKKHGTTSMMYSVQKKNEKQKRLCEDIF
jgi:hypothetical protein